MSGTGFYDSVARVGLGNRRAGLRHATCDMGICWLLAHPCDLHMDAIRYALRPEGHGDSQGGLPDEWSI